MSEGRFAPVALLRMNRGFCPECGVVAEKHDTQIGSWGLPALVTDCWLTPADVRERLEQFNEYREQNEQLEADQQLRKEESSESETIDGQQSGEPQS